MNNCRFCNGELKQVYKMDNYNILRCKKCGTGTTSPMPTKQELNEFYKGFTPNLDISVIEKKTDLAIKFFKHFEIKENSNLSFLDIGGGAGLYSYAFENGNFGKSTYIDLDKTSYEFVKNNLNLTNTFQGNIEDSKEITEKFDIIYARHLIEHLLEPEKFILDVFEKLNDTDKLILQYPNGQSLEYLGYLPMLKPRLKKILTSSKISKNKLILKILCGQLLHGIDPPRHLWAITKKGMEIFCKNNNTKHTAYKFKLSDKVYTPMWNGKNSFLGSTLANLKGGTHLVSVFERK